MGGKQAPKIEHVQVAATLRRMREEAGISRERAADMLACTVSKISDLETGRSKPKPVELEKLLNEYGVAPEEQADLIEFARTSRGRRPRGPFSAPALPGHHRRAADLEAQATSIVFYSSEIIPGILQVRPYAEAMVSWGKEGRSDEVSNLVTTRMQRAAALSRTNRAPLRYWCVLGEAALWTNIGGPKVMCEQLAHLIQLNLTMENVVIQILPLGSGPHAFLGITATLYQLPDPAPDILMMDTHSRMVFQDRSSDVELAKHHLELIKAKALGREDSTEFMQQRHQELQVG
ncbi:helix-turn-helix domain-containing protein [Goodfellowiella coeruleoviolacea]|uniref:Helix-turn-helix domain-containing protein n=1 Tax=Goodfellowiella coeruleoviolacea TaxID=334858 RepID=A0AAE3KGF7_9PSEU|nr:helix-turn-helix transcriptional regulator [Goodfellowiella coeruleoviolacea]MCP2165832.1 Helix-turn-helix domain-containing protein [Goodfellowiella coeruleoviolacea]